MTLLLTIIYFIVCVAMITWGLWKKDRYYQFPTVIGATWLFVLGPQVINAMVKSEKYPPGALDDYGLEIAILMSILCALMGWIGYAVKPRNQIVKTTCWSDKKCLTVGLFFYAVGLLFEYKMIQYIGGAESYFVGGGYRVDQWGGELVKYKFFAKLLYVGLTCTIFSTLIRPCALRLILSGAFLVYPLCSMFFIGDRTDAAVFLFAIAVPFYFVKRWSPPRTMIVVAMFFAGIACVVWPQYRILTSEGRFDELRQVDAKQILSGKLFGEEYAEFDIMVVLGAAINREGNFGLGTGIYNGLVFGLFPGQILGQEIKQKLMLNRPLRGRTAEELYGWAPPRGSTATGPASVFFEFWFFGCIAYLSIGFVYRRLWERARLSGNLGFQILYICLVPVVPYLVIVGINAFLVVCVYQLFFLLFCLYYIREKKLSFYRPNLSCVNNWELPID